jgi:hypothetical protein
MRIVRFSNDGFEPQYQSYHLKKMPYCDNEKLVEYGVWAFLDGYIKVNDLDRLGEFKHVWVADIFPDSIVVDATFSKLLKITEQECKDRGFFIPQSSMNSIKNIKQIF